MEESVYCKLLQSLRIFRIFPEFWRAPISPNFQNISRILEGSYLSKFQNEGGSNPSEFWTFMSKVLTFPKSLSFKTVFQIKKRWKIDVYLFVGIYFLSFWEIKINFCVKREQKLTKRLIWPYFCLAYPTRGVITCRFEFNY